MTHRLDRDSRSKAAERNQQAGRGTSNRPEISVVVPTRDRGERLSRLLESMRAQTLGREAFELIVVDDGSRDDTPAILERERSRGELQLSVIARRHGAGPAAARNEGWRAASASVIAFTDDDCAAHPNWLDALCAATRANPEAIVQGRTEVAAEELDAVTIFSRTIKVTEAGPFFHTCNVAYPRRMLEALGGFDEQVFGQQPGGEDTDLAWRAIERGTETVFAADARVFHAVNHFGVIGSLRFPLRWSDAMAVFRRHPGMRRYIYRGLFWKRSHALMLEALVGLLIVRRFPPAALLAYPYAKDVLRRTRQRGSPSIHAPHLALQDMVEAYATIRGAVRHRVLVL